MLVVHVDIPDNRTPTVTARSPEHSGAPRDHGSRPRETLRRYLSLIYIIIMTSGYKPQQPELQLQRAQLRPSGVVPWIAVVVHDYVM